MQRGVVEGRHPGTQDLLYAAITGLRSGVADSPIRLDVEVRAVHRARRRLAPSRDGEFCSAKQLQFRCWRSGGEGGCDAAGDERQSQQRDEQSQMSGPRATFGTGCHGGLHRRLTPSLNPALHFTRVAPQQSRAPWLLVRYGLRSGERRIRNGRSPLRRCTVQDSAPQPNTTSAGNRER